MDHITEYLFNKKVVMNYFSDDNAAHFILNGEHFKHNHELLKLIVKFDGACTEDTSPYGLTINCNFDCLNCSKSIYHIIQVQERFFQMRCEELCKRAPKAGDEWEVSLVSYDGIMPKYQNFHFRCLENLGDEPIISLCYQIIHQKYAKFYEQSKYCYMKVRRFDMEKAIDVSSVANHYFQGLMDGVSLDQIAIPIGQ